jgi:hypothetical protein
MTIKDCFKNHVRGFIKQSIVDKTNMMCPFCVGHHVNIHSDVLVASIMTNARKKFNLHPSCLCYVWQPKVDSIAIELVIENIFGHHKINNRIFNFLIRKFSNQKFSIANF